MSRPAAFLGPIATGGLLLLFPEVALAEDRALRGGAAIISPLIEKFVGAAQQIAKALTTRLASETLTLLNYAFLIWLLLQVAQMMLGMSGGASTLWSIVRRSALYMIVAFMLAAVPSGAYWTWFVEEPIRISSALSSEAMGRSGCGGGSAAEAASCLARAIEQIFTYPMHAAWESMKATEFTLDGVVSGAVFSQYLAGALLVLISFIGLVFFAFFILDIVLRILILAMFSPVFVAAFLFNPTRGWATKAAWSLVGSVATLVGGAAVLAMLEAAIRDTLGGGGWQEVVSRIVASSGSYDSPINLDRVVFWQSLFLTLVSVGVAKGISQMMASVFNSAPAGSPMADKVAGIASIPAKGAVAATVIGAGFLGYLGAKGIGAGIGAGARYGLRKGGQIMYATGDGVRALKNRIQFGTGPRGGGTSGGGVGGGGTPGGGSGGGGTPGGGSGGGGTGPLGGGTSGGGSGGGGAPGSGSGGSSVSPNGNAGGGGNAAGSTAQAAAGAAPAAAGAAQAATGAGSQETRQMSDGKKKVSAYKTAFIYKTLKQAGVKAADTIDPTSHTGT